MVERCAGFSIVNTAILTSEAEETSKLDYDINYRIVAWTCSHPKLGNESRNPIIAKCFQCKPNQLVYPVWGYYGFEQRSIEITAWNRFSKNILIGTFSCWPLFNPLDSERASMILRGAVSLLDNKVLIGIYRRLISDIHA